MNVEMTELIIIDQTSDGDCHCSCSKTAHVPAELRHGIRKAQHASTNHGGHIVERRVPPLGVPGGGDGQPVVDGLLLLLLPRRRRHGRLRHRRSSQLRPRPDGGEPDDRAASGRALVKTAGRDLREGAVARRRCVCRVVLYRYGGGRRRDLANDLPRSSPPYFPGLLVVDWLGAAEMGLFLCCRPSPGALSQPSPAQGLH